MERAVLSKHAPPVSLVELLWGNRRRGRLDAQRSVWPRPAGNGFGAATIRMLLMSLGLTLPGCQTTPPRQPGVLVSGESPDAAPMSEPARRAPPPALTPSTTAAPDYRGFPVAVPQLVSPMLGPFYERLAEQFDPRHWYLTRDQEAWKGFVPLSHTPLPSFPGRSFAAVRAFFTANDHVYPAASELDDTVPGCGGSAVARDGTLCPTTLHPGVVLSARQADTFLSIVNAPNDAPRVIMNGYNFTLGLVLFDAKGVPVAEVDVDRDITKLRARPPVRRAEVDTMSPLRRSQMRALLTELGLVADGGERERLFELDQQQEQLDGDRHPVRYIPTASGVDTNVLLNEISSRERTLLCAWQVQVWRRGFPSPRGSGIACDDGTTLIGLSFTQCRLRVPSCPNPVGEIERCMRQQRFDPCLAEEASRPCRRLRPCFWGMSLGTAILPPLVLDDSGLPEPKQTEPVCRLSGGAS